MSKNSLTLIGSTTSPYVRKLRIYMHYNQIPFEFKSINYMTAEDGAFLKELNPINKIPVLLIDQKPLFDSRIIYQYLNRDLVIKNQTESDSIDDENALSMIDGFLETAVNLFSLHRAGIDILNSGNSYIEKQVARLDLILNNLIPWTESAKAQNWNFHTMSLYCSLEWGNFREMIVLTNYPELQTFVEKFSNSEYVVETKIIVPT